MLLYSQINMAPLEVFLTRPMNIHCHGDKRRKRTLLSFRALTSYNGGLSKFCTICHSFQLKVADLNFGCATFCALPSFNPMTTSSSHMTFSSHKVNVKGSDIDMCSAIYFLFDHNTKYCTIYLCQHTVLATVLLSPWRLGNRT